MSRRSLWGSMSTYKSDLISSLPQRPSNVGAYICIVLGISGLVFALFVGSDKSLEGFAVVAGLFSLLFLLCGIGLRKPPHELVVAQSSWDKRWMCARCGHQWEP